tara:strand:- start:44 stop:700 length:657 start_codon:yes stop_codon:yes gene_type:complete
MINKNKIIELDNKTNIRYNFRLDKFGDDPKTLGWDNRKNQIYRFENSLRGIKLSNKRILDIGCGLGDFYSFIFKKFKSHKFVYTGVDINSKLINLCKRKFNDTEFINQNILIDKFEDRSWDIVTMFGLLNLKLNEFSNIIYSKEFIREAFNLCEELLIVDMLSSYNDKEYKKEDFVYYHDPLDMIKFALELTPYVSFIHDNKSIPQREFILILRKIPC